MSMLEMVKHHSYPVTHSFIETKDGYILDLYRIPGPRYEKLEDALEEKRKPVLMVHGTL